MEIHQHVSEIPDLPQEMVEEIMVRLPAKSLGRFTCVSKTWCSVISSKRFIKSHIRQSSMNRSFDAHKVITSRFCVQQWPLRSLLYEDEASARALNYDYPLDIFEYDPSEVVGCCDGLVCVLSDEWYFILWNPTTKKQYLLPSIHNETECGDVTMYGFGYDESSDDYKVFGSISDDYFGRGKVYSLKAGSWRHVDGKTKVISIIDQSGKFARGKLHWVRMAEPLPNVRWDIISFDLENEVHGLVELPRHTEDGYYPFLGVLDGCLCLGCDYHETRLDVWILKQHGIQQSWYKMATVPYPRVYEENPFVDLLFIGGNGEILLVCGSTFVIYHPQDGRLSYPSLNDWEAFDGVHVFVESLVSVVPDVQPDILPTTCSSTGAEIDWCSHKDNICWLIH